MKGVHGPGPYFHGPGPWTRSMEGVHGPGVHVLYFPDKYYYTAISKLNIVHLHRDFRTESSNKRETSI